MKRFVFDHVRDYESFASHVEMHLQKLLEDFNYNTVGNFLTFYNAYKRSGYQNLADFFQRYSPPVRTSQLSCVGLALKLWDRLHELDIKYMEISSYFFVASCEENIEDLPLYLAYTENLETAEFEKEHVLLCLRFKIDGRHGILLCDPGYHVGRVVTVMQDGLYPHTGWFIQSEEGEIRKEYNYQFIYHNENFVEWNERTTRNGVQKIFTGLIHVARAYLTGVDVTERRNLVYNFKSLLSRDQKGHLIAGVYFKIKENYDELTMFYQNMGKQRLKINFSSLMAPQEINKKCLDAISICNDQLNLAKNTLLLMLQQVGAILNDKVFLQSMLEINQLASGEN